MGFRIHRGIFQKLNAERTAYENTFKIDEDGRIKEVDSEGNVTTGYLKVGEQANDADTVDGLHSGSFLRSDAHDSFSGNLTATTNDWYIYGFGTRGASAGAYGIGNRNDDSYRQMTFHVPDQAAYSSSGTIPSFGWYSNGASQLMKLNSGSGNLWVKGSSEFDGRVYADDGLHVRGDWVRVNGNNGIYFESHGGGWQMIDSTWIRAHNNKNIYTGGSIEVGGTVRSDSGFKVDGSTVIDGSGVVVTNINNDTTDSNYFIQAAHGNPRNNLGSPTVTEMALFDNQFRCMTDLSNSYTNLDRVTFWVQQNEGDAWAEVTVSDDQKKRFLRTNNSNVAIPNRAYKYRVEFKAPGYVYANALYFYWSSNSHSTKVHVYKYNASQDTWHAHATSNTNVSSWPGHLYLPFSTIPWHETATTSTGHHRYVRVEFIPNWSGHATYGGYAISLNGGQIWGGYPSGRRTPHRIDHDGNYFFPATLYADNGSSSASALATRGWVGDQDYATRGFVTTSLDDLVDSAPGALNTLNELAAALGDDANFSTTVTNAIAAKADSSHTHGIGDVTDAARWWNNFGDNHTTRTGFDAETAALTTGFGWRYVQGNSNSPGTNNNSQFYSLVVGLGNDYNYDNYGMQLAIPRDTTTPYISIRYEENRSLGAWQKISAGYADSAGAVAWGNVTGKPSTFAPSSHNHDSAYLGITAKAADSNLLDGIDSGSFLRSDASDSFSGTLTGTATAENLKVGGIRGTAKGSQTGDYMHLYERVHIGGPNGWGAASHGAPGYGLSTWGSVDFGMNGSGVIQLDGTTIVTAARALTNVTNTNWDAAYTKANAAPYINSSTQARPDFNSLIPSANTTEYKEVHIIEGGSNFPSGAYTYGVVHSQKMSSMKFQWYVPHTASRGDNNTTDTIYFRTGWGDSQIYDWKYLIHSGNIAGQSVSFATTAGSANAVTWGNVSGKPSTFTPSSHSHHYITNNYSAAESGSFHSWDAQESTPDKNPTTDWFTSLRIGHGHPVNYYSNTLAIQMTGGDSGRIYTRTITNGSKGTWKKYWHGGDFTSTNISNWSTAYGWGNHATAGYVTSVTDALGYTPYQEGTALSASTIDGGSKLKVQAGHNDARMVIAYNHNGDSTSENSGNLVMWTSEPGISYASSGIGGNVHESGHYYGKRNTNIPFGVALRFNVTSGRAEFLATNSTNNGSFGVGWYVDDRGNTVQQGSITAPGYNSGNWDTAYGWGNHSSAGYLTSVPNLAASKITSGTFANARISQSSVTQHQSALSIAASQVSGLPAQTAPVQALVEGGDESTLSSITFNPGEGSATFTLADGQTFILAFAR